SMIVELIVDDRLMEECEVECDARIVGDQHRALFEHQLDIDLTLNDGSDSDVTEMRAELLHVRVQTEDRSEVVLLDQRAQSVTGNQRFPTLKVAGFDEALWVLQPRAPSRHDHELAVIDVDIISQQGVESGKARHCHL